MKNNRFIFSREKITKYSLVFVLFVFVFITSTPLKAGAVSEKTIGGSLVATLIPKEPGANQEVKVNLAGYGYNLDESKILWYINGSPIQDATGKKSMFIKTPNIGEVMTLNILVITSSGRTIAKKIVFSPAEVDLVWEADTYTPAFFNGARLATVNSLIKVTAIPQIIDKSGQPMSSKDLVFTWKKDYRNLVKDSGLGKESIYFNAGLTSTSHNIEVTVSSPSDSSRAYKKIQIVVNNPEILVYPYLPLTGANYSKAIKTLYQSSKKDESFKAEPFFFNNSEVKRNSIYYFWQANNKKIPPSADDGSILNNTGEIDLSGEVEISVRSGSYVNQSTQIYKNFKAILEKSLFDI